MMHGVYTAVVTPFRNGQVDYQALAAIVEQQIAGGVTGIVAVGTTGESPTLDHHEHSEVIRFVVEKAAKRVKVVAGTGSNSTQEAIELTIQAHKNGADATLQVAPYYNKPTQEGMYLHFKAIAAATPLPVILYNVPGRCSAEITVETVARLAQLPTVQAIKEASGNVDRVSQIRLAAPGLAVMSGDDALTLPMMACGATGVISVLSNAMPAEMSLLVKLAAAGDFAQARTLHEKLHPLMTHCFIEANPIPVKTLMAKLGLCVAEYRLPLCPLSEKNLAPLLAAARSAGLKV